MVSDYATAEQAPSGLNWDYVYNYKNSSAVAVDAYWILTAAHVADDGGSGSLTIDSTTYTQQEIVFHDEADLALVRYDQPLPGSYDFYTGAFSGAEEMIMVGFGTTGVVVDVTGGGPLNQDYWTDSGTGRGTKRWGTQFWDRNAADVDYTVGGLTTTNSGFWMDFTVNDSLYEAGVGVGDSGGGTFIADHGTWKLAGINTLRSGSDGEYTSTFGVSAQDYSGWITETIPEPTVASLIMLLGGGLLAGKRLFA